MSLRCVLAFVLALTLAGCARDTTTTTDALPPPTPTTSAATPKTAPSTEATSRPTHDTDGALVPKGLQTGKPGLSTQGRRLFGADISWPQCPRGMGIPGRETLGAPMPTAAATFVIIGLTNGPSFTPNPCLGDQVAWARDRRLLTAAYAVISWPHQKTVDKLGGSGPYGASRPDQLRNVGHHSARYTVEQMRSAGLKSPIIWLDVEPVPGYEWAGTIEEQAALVEGAVRGYRDAGLRVGIYSTPAMYRNIVGGLRLKLPEWRAAGQTSMAEALNRCGPDWSIQGGPGIFGQWVEANRDRNVTCPGVDLALPEWFVQF